MAVVLSTAENLVTGTQPVGRLDYMLGLSEAGFRKALGSSVKTVILAEAFSDIARMRFRTDCRKAH